MNKYIIDSSDIKARNKSRTVVQVTGRLRRVLFYGTD